MGDVAGIGPELIVKAWSSESLHQSCLPYVIGSPRWLERAKVWAERPVRVTPVSRLEELLPARDLIPCLNPLTPEEDAALSEVETGHVNPRAGWAAYRFLTRAIDCVQWGHLEAITTLPLSKEALRLAGVAHPGHTEILAERLGTHEFAMMLYLATDGSRSPIEAESSVQSGLGVVHVTLHLPLREVPDRITKEAVIEKIRLADRAMRPLLSERTRPRIAVSSLNPHSGERGLFGDEEIRVIGPAVVEAQAAGFDVAGPFPNDTLFHTAVTGAFDAVVAMYHDLGHVALKTLGFHRAVNVTVGLPIVRTSVAHGTAFDIAGRGRADPRSLIEAVRVAARLASSPLDSS